MLPITLLAIAIVLIFILNVYIQITSDNSMSIDAQAKKSCIVANTIQNMFEIIGSEKNATEKIEELNNVILAEFKPKYSSIVLYDGNDFEVKASNVEKEFRDSIKNVATENTFSAYVTKNISKYIVATEYKTLSYRSALERNIKSTIFSPIYFNDTFLGFWLIEDVKEHSFNDLADQDLAKFKYNIGLFIENVLDQNTIEVAESTDKQTGFYNNTYLYSNSRPIIMAHDTSSLTLICLNNIPDVNEKYGRNISNTLLVKIANDIKETVSKESLLIRYSGLRLLIITPGSNAQLAQPIIEKVLTNIKNEVEYIDDEKVTLTAQILIHTIKKQNNVEKEIQDMVSYIDQMEQVNTIKII
ncbi:MAG: diguanylate cyclase [Clostridia bacterium]|nr:diguanylate cyclase [Clostridia bacterium]